MIFCSYFQVYFPPECLNIKFHYKEWWKTGQSLSPLQILLYLLQVTCKTYSGDSQEYFKKENHRAGVDWKGSLLPPFYRKLPAQELPPSVNGNCSTIIRSIFNIKWPETRLQLFTLIYDLCCQGLFAHSQEKAPVQVCEVMLLHDISQMTQPVSSP